MPNLSTASRLGRFQVPNLSTSSRFFKHFIFRFAVGRKIVKLLAAIGHWNERWQRDAGTVCRKPAAADAQCTRSRAACRDVRAIDLVFAYLIVIWSAGFGPSDLRHMLLRLSRADEGFDQCTSPECPYSRVQIWPFSPNKHVHADSERPDLDGSADSNNMSRQVRSGVRRQHAERFA